MRRGVNYRLSLVNAILLRSFKSPNGFFCESLQALRQALDAGLPRDWITLFRSPELGASSDIINGFNLDLRARGKSKTYRDIYLETEQTTHSLYRLSLKYFNKSQSLIIGWIYQEWLDLCYSDSLLRRADLSEKRLIIDPVVDRKLQPTYRRAHWNLLTDGHIGIVF